MRTHASFHRLVTLPVVFAFLLLSCTLGTGSKPEAVSFHESPELLTVPATGLAGLQSYRVSFQQDVVGTLDGAPFERHTHIELVRLGTQVDFLREIHGSQEASFFRAFLSDQAVYRWDAADGYCQGQAGALREGEIVEPAALLLPVLETSRVGSETVNGIATVHYHFKQGGLALIEPKPEISGDYWLAEDGGFVVKYVLQAAAPSNPTGSGMEAGISYAYELSQVNSLETISLPERCMPVPLDLPVTVDATNVHRSSGSVNYQTASSVANVVELYYDQLGALGWSEETEKPSGDVKTPLGLLFSQGELKLSINIGEYETGSLDVDLLVYNPNEPMVVSPSGPTPVPTLDATPSGPQPTIDPAQSGLPENIPLYPGAAGLEKFGGSVVMFTAPDAPDQVAAWYHEQMAALGWDLLNELNEGGQIVQAWQTSSIISSMSISLEAGKTKVVISWNTQ